MQHILDFVRSVGIVIEERAFDEKSFLPGILIKDGRIYIDKEKLLYPGDILHEAGHLAVMPPEERRTACNNMSDNKTMDNATAEEMMAIAWSYAALTHLGIAPEVVFHPAGYKGASTWYIDLFAKGGAPGLPLLKWLGMCHDADSARENNAQPYPHMEKWLRD